MTESLPGAGADKASFDFTREIAALIAASPCLAMPADAIDAAKKSLVDWFAVCAVAMADREAHRVDTVARRWNASGQSLSMFGAVCAPPTAAFVNATLAHWLDYDDLHLASAFHASCPSWATALAIGMGKGSSEAEILTSVIVGYEIGSQIGSDGIGIRLGTCGWHPTTVLAPFSAVSTAAVLLRLDEARAQHAIGLAASRAAGLTAMSGSTAKPLQVGLATMDGLIAAELAAEGLTAASSILNAQPEAAFRVLFQDKDFAFTYRPLGESWQIVQNSFKPFASCQLTHAPIEAAQNAYKRIAGRDIKSVDVLVNPFAMTIAGKTRPQTPNDAKFSVSYCTALGLAGRNVSLDDFSEAAIHDDTIRTIADRVQISTSDAVERWSTKLDVRFSDGSTESVVLDEALGSLGCPMTWSHLEDKFRTSCEPVFGRQSEQALELLKAFERPGSRAKLEKLLKTRSA